jgi:hypothetical protein
MTILTCCIKKNWLSAWVLSPLPSISRSLMFSYSSTAATQQSSRRRLPTHHTHSRRPPSSEPRLAQVIETGTDVELTVVEVLTWLENDSYAGTSAGPTSNSCRQLVT